MVEYTIVADGYTIYSSSTPELGLVLSPQLKLEINKSGSLAFTMLPGHERYDYIYPMKTLILVYQDSEILFRGRVIEAKSDFYKQKKVTCEGDISFLLDSVMRPFTYDGNNKKSIRDVFKMIVDNHNSQMIGNSTWKRFSYSNGYIDVTINESSSATDTDEWNHTSFGSTLDAITSEFLDAYGGVLRTRTEETNGTFVTYLDYIKDPSQSLGRYPLNNQEIEFGVNLLDFDRAYPVSDIFTVLMPVGSDKLTIESVNGGSPYLENVSAISKFGRIVKAQEWNDVKNPQELLAKARQYMNEHSGIYADDLTVKAIDLHYLNSSESRLKLCDLVKVYSEPHGIGTNSDMVLFCLAIDYDLQNPENNRYKLGSFIPSEKKKNKSTQKATKSGKRKGGRSKKASGISNYQINTNDIVQEVVDNVIDNSNTDTKGFLSIVGDKAKDYLGVVFDPGDGPVEKAKKLWEKIGVGNNEGKADGSAIEDITDLFDIGQYAEERDPETGEITSSEGIKTLSETTDDIVRIDGDIVQINANLVEINANIIDINTDITIINSRTITIGSGEGSVITFDGDVVLTQAIENLIVNKLQASQIESITISVAGSINTGSINVGRLTVSGKIVVPDVIDYLNDKRQSVNFNSLQDYLNRQSYATTNWADNKFSITKIKDKYGGILPNMDVDTAWMNGHWVYIVANN